MKQFNLEEYKKNPSRKVVTREGRDNRILCTDRKGDYPIVGLVQYGEIELLVAWSSEGLYDKDGVNPFDLLFAPTKHEGWVNLYRSGVKKDGYIYMGQGVFRSEDDAIKIGRYGKDNNQYLSTSKIEWEE